MRHAFSMDIISKTNNDVIFFISSFLPMKSSEICKKKIGNVGHEKYSPCDSLRQHIASAYGNRMNVRPRYTEYFNYQLNRRGN